MFIFRALMMSDVNIYLMATSASKKIRLKKIINGEKSVPVIYIRYLINTCFRADSNSNAFRLSLSSVNFCLCHPTTCVLSIDNSRVRKKYFLNKHIPLCNPPSFLLGCVMFSAFGILVFSVCLQLL